MKATVARMGVALTASAGGIRVADGGTGTVVHCTLLDNTAAEALGGGGVLATNAALVLRNSILWGNSPTQLTVVAGPQAVVTHNAIERGWPGEGNRAWDPLLSADYRLTVRSWCIGASTNLTVELDRDGEPRSPDIGSDEFTDTDGDHLPDVWELRYGLDPNDPNDDLLDPDDDGMCSAEEYWQGRNPVVSDVGGVDADGDRMRDAWETTHGLNTSTNDAWLDADGDGLSNIREFWAGTNPSLADTDGDGASDSAEIYAGSSPTDPADYPLSPAPVGLGSMPTVTVTVQLGSRYLGVNGSDKDRDGIVDWLDGYNADGIEGTPDDINVRKRFTPVYITVTADCPIASLRFNLQYPTNTVRLWLIDGMFRRKLADVSDGGSLVPPGLRPLWDMGSRGTYSWTLYAEGLAPGAFTNSLAEGEWFSSSTGWTPFGVYGPDGGDEGFVLEMDLTPNYDRDLDIDGDDRTRVRAGETFHFWINDDDDSGFEGGDDIPGAPGFWSRQDWRDDNPLWYFGQYRVDGVRDLVDFFPVFVDLKTTLNILGTSEYKYMLKHADGAVNALLDETLGPDDAGHHLFNKGFGEAHSNAILTHIEADGVQLSTSLLNAIKNEDKGVILLEGRAATTAPLVLEVQKTDGTLVMTASMPLSLSPVNEMFRCVNLRPAAGGAILADDFITATNVPPNYPDALCTETNLLFTHGYLPDKGETTASGWIAEAFKRFHSSGSRARYCGVLWRSGQGGKMNYQQNLYNAFLTASNLAVYVNGLSGPSVIVAHSLGNVMVSSSIADHGMSADKYFLLDAAVPAEAYDSSVTDDSRMVHTWWDDYTNACWAANWHRLFDATNTRSRLTWIDRFSNVLTNTTAYNFYSTGDEVFELTTAPTLLSGVFYFKWRFKWIPFDVDIEGGHHSWQKQEVFKGTLYCDWLGTWGATQTAGWGLKSSWVEDPPGSDDWKLTPDYTPAAAAAVAAADPTQFTTNPVFRHTPEWLLGTSILTQPQQNEMLAKGIPSLTPSAGNTGMTGAFLPARRFDLNTDATFRPNGWPREPDDDPYGDRWLHNDVRVMAYLYTYKLFHHVVLIGGLE